MPVWPDMNCESLTRRGLPSKALHLTSYLYQMPILPAQEVMKVPHSLESRLSMARDLRNDGQTNLDAPISPNSKSDSK